jgi:tetratricopeptide (TPR) repeat protein
VPRLDRLIRVFQAPPVSIAALALVLAVTPGARAQQPAWDWPEKAKNLKALPSDTPKEKLRAVMTGFTRALGVRCSHCHVGEEGMPLSTFDFASDKNPKKGIARDMYRMLGEINAELKRMPLEGSSRVNMWCHTCHRGLRRPASLVEELTATYDSAGIDSTVAAYRSLRERLLDRGAFDFGEGSLVELGLALSRRGRHEDAIRILQLNVERFPKSPRAHDGLADGYREAGRKEDAIQTYRTILELEPENRSARRRLEELLGTGK